MYVKVRKLTQDTSLIDEVGEIKVDMEFWFNNEITSGGGSNWFFNYEEGIWWGLIDILEYFFGDPIH